MSDVTREELERWEKAVLFSGQRIFSKDMLCRLIAAARRGPELQGVSDQLLWQAAEIARLKRVEADHLEEIANLKRRLGYA